MLSLPLLCTQQTLFAGANRIVTGTYKNQGRPIAITDYPVLTDLPPKDSIRRVIALHIAASGIIRYKGECVKLHFGSTPATVAFKTVTDQNLAFDCSTGITLHNLDIADTMAPAAELAGTLIVAPYIPGSQAAVRPSRNASGQAA
jgi:hypothetical protein